MSSADSQLRGVRDPRLAIHAASPLPAWLWSADGAHVLWANPVGASALGAPSSKALAGKTFGPADQRRRRVAHLADQLLPTGAVRLERLQGFSNAIGGMATCACARLEFADGGAGILIAVLAPPGRVLPLNERLQRLVAEFDTPAAAFAGDGMFVAANAAARPLLGVRDLSEAGLDDARAEALRDGRAETSSDIGHVVLQRVGSGSDVAVISLIEPGAVARAPTRPVSAVAEPVADLAQSTRGDILPAPPSPAAPPNHQATAAVAPEAPPTSPGLDSKDDEPAESHLSEETPGSLPETATQDVAPPSSPQPAEPPAAAAAPPTPPDAESVAVAPAWDDVAPRPARRSLRFTWQMDADGRFLLGSDEFTRLMGLRSATAFGRPWQDLVASFDLDPAGLVAKAVATRSTWSGVTLNWPVDPPGERLAVELSGLPIYDHQQNFAGYCGFGVCRDLDAVARLAALRHRDLFSEAPAPHPLTADVPHRSTDRIPLHRTGEPGPPETKRTSSTEPDDPVETPILDTPQNVVHLRPNSELKSPALTPVENSAFNELARQLSERLEIDHAAATPDERGDGEDAVGDEEFGWLSVEELAAFGSSGRDKPLLDVLPVGVLIYRLEQLLYANSAFVSRMGFSSLHALRVAGGLDAIYIAPNPDAGKSAAEAGTPVVITAQGSAARADARLLAIEWNGETVLALIVADRDAPSPAHPAQAAGVAGSGQITAEGLGVILDTAAEGVVMFDGDGRISACNRSAEALFGYDGESLVRRNLVELLAPESRGGVQDRLAAITSPGVVSLLDQGREVLGRVRSGGVIPLSMTTGRAGADSPNFFAVFRDLSQSRKIEAQLAQARRQSERGMAATADVLGRVSHDIRMPLNAIIGFAEVMIDERFGPLGNERYAEYLKDIRASGERVIAIIDEMLDLSRIETGKLELAFASQNLNDLVEQCVAVLQPRANRERIIIRTSLARTLPDVVADARTLRQITLNLIGSSIHLANAGGQVIVSTALSDAGDVVLRVRDTGSDLNDDELAAALEPFRTAEQTPDHSGMSLSVAKALVEANRAHFQIKSVPHAGSLIEVTFSHAVTGT